MGKHLFYNPLTQETQIVEEPDEEIDQPTPVPSDQERIAALESALLSLIMGS